MAEKLVKYIDPRTKEEQDVIYRNPQRCVKTAETGAGWKIEGNVPRSGKLYRVYCPDMSPEAVSIISKYLIYTMSPVEGRAVYHDGCMVDRNNALACTPFRYEDNDYQEYMLINLGDAPGRYVAVLPGNVSDGLFIPDRNLQGSQAYIGPADPDAALSCALLIGPAARKSIRNVCECEPIRLDTLGNIVDGRPYDKGDEVCECGCAGIPESTLENIVNDRPYDTGDEECADGCCKPIPNEWLNYMTGQESASVPEYDDDCNKPDSCEQYYVCMWCCDRKYQSAGTEQYVWGTDNILQLLKDNFGFGEGRIESEILVRDNDNIYVTVPMNMEEDNHCLLPADLNPDVFTDNSQYSDELYLQAQITVYDSDNEVYTILRSHPHPITPEFFAMMLARENKIDIPQDMTIEKPRFINRTIQRVYEMTAKTDSKSNIIQPVFFRTRDAANIVIHPAVTENICINLDAYKSQCTSFILKIEGVFFQELGRTASGIIFKIQGNLLPGETDSGIYYILNEDSELITTGRYTYEK